MPRQSSITSLLDNKLCLQALHLKNYETQKLLNIVLTPFMLFDVFKFIFSSQDLLKFIVHILYNATMPSTNCHVYYAISTTTRASMSFTNMFNLHLIIKCSSA